MTKGGKSSRPSTKKEGGHPLPIAQYHFGQWLPVPRSQLELMYRLLPEVWCTYANVVDYGRIVVALVAFAAVSFRASVLAAVAIVLSYILDWVDGPLARYFDQCSDLGGTLDWYADTMTSIAQVVWWAQVDPLSASLLGWPFLCVEVAYMTLDVIHGAQGTFPNVANGPGAVVIPLPLRWCMRPGTEGDNYTFTHLYTLLWFNFPLTACALCLHYDLGWIMWSSPSLASLAADLWLCYSWSLGIALCLAFMVVDCQLLFLLFWQWAECRHRGGDDFSVGYSDLESSVVGGCTVFYPTDDSIKVTAEWLQQHGRENFFAPNSVLGGARVCDSVEALAQCLGGTTVGRSEDSKSRSFTLRLESTTAIAVLGDPSASNWSLSHEVGSDGGIVGEVTFRNQRKGTVLQYAAGSRITLRATDPCRLRVAVISAAK